MAKAETTVGSSNLYTGVGEANPRPPMSFKRGYSEVGHKIFAIDTEHVKQMKVKTAAQKRKNARPSSAKPFKP